VLVFGYLITAAVCVTLVPWIEPFSPSSVRAYTAESWTALLVLSVFSWGLAMVLWMYLLKRLDVSQASVSIYLLPFLGVLLSAISLHEKITATMAVGGLVTLAGTILITSIESSTSAEPKES
jgi:drug/metabolite transporter (DMT)-like permease